MPLEWCQEALLGAQLPHPPGSGLNEFHNLPKLNKWHMCPSSYNKNPEEDAEKNEDYWEEEEEDEEGKR